MRQDGSRGWSTYLQVHAGGDESNHRSTQHHEGLQSLQLLLSKPQLLDPSLSPTATHRRPRLRKRTHQSITNSKPKETLASANGRVKG